MYIQLLKFTCFISKGRRRDKNCFNLNTSDTTEILCFQIIFGQDIEIRTSNTNEVFIPESSTQEITPSIDDGIYLGGLGSQNKMISGKSKLR